MRASIRLGTLFVTMSLGAPACFVDQPGLGSGGTGGDGTGAGVSVGGQGGMDTTTTSSTAGNMPTGGGGSGGMTGLCGDGQQTGTEECDDGDAEQNDECLSDCIVATCGDGFVKDAAGVDSPEQCDEGDNNSDTGDCTTDCRNAFCGDGFVKAADPDKEACDDGNMDNTDECTNDCALPACGDGFVQPVAGEDCDTADPATMAGCDANCHIVCGDWLAAATEECDDNNTNDGDGCNSTCQLEDSCGNGTIEPGETCDGAGCSLTCMTLTFPACAAATAIPSPDFEGTPAAQTSEISGDTTNSVIDDASGIGIHKPSCAGSDSSRIAVHKYTTGPFPSILTAESMDKDKDNVTTFTKSVIWISYGCAGEATPPTEEACSNTGGAGGRAKTTTGFIPARTTVFILIGGEGDPNAADEKGKYRIQVTEQPVRLFYGTNFPNYTDGATDQLGLLTSMDVAGGDTQKWQLCTPKFMNNSCPPFNNLKSRSLGAFAWGYGDTNTMLSDMRLTAPVVDTTPAVTSRFVQYHYGFGDVGMMARGKMEVSTNNGANYTNVSGDYKDGVLVGRGMFPLNTASAQTIVRFQYVDDSQSAANTAEAFMIDDLFIYGY